FERLFGSSVKKEDQPQIPFGRYSDSYKSKSQYDSWDVAVKKFEQGSYLDSYREFFKYLSDPSQGNLKMREENGEIFFELIQGSKKVTGYANNQSVKARAKVVHCNTLNVGFMRRLMEKNYSLKYGRFALDDDNDIAILFDTYVVDGTPWKLYYALKEIANNADKQDDLLVDEFDMLTAINTSHVSEIPETEKALKYQFIINTIQGTLDRIKGLDPVKFSGGIAYLLLYAFYKLDYLIRPEGFMMETLERAHRTYFARDNKSTDEKNRLLIKELETLLGRSKEDFFREMYRVTATFGITSPVNHDRVKNLIDGEINNMDWYINNDYPDIALSVPGYIACYNLFNFAVPQPDRELFHLLIEILEQRFFKSLGFTFNFYDHDQKKFDKSAIKREIQSIVKTNIGKFPKLNPDVGTLNYNSLPEFAKSFMMMVKDLDLSAPNKN
ncbi:MAG: hypothetical protein AAFV80_05905, partial [Bacteroidota bacterium]